jgi:RHS repeat-associated protein
MKKFHIFPSISLLNVTVLTALFSLLHLSPVLAVTPSSSQNYIVTYTPRVATTDLSSLPDTSTCPSIQYFDGLGRPVQTVAVAATPGLTDLGATTQYDGMGRPYKTWLPVVNNGAGAYVDPANGIPSLASTSYPSESKPYSLNLYDGSPLNRVVKEYGPGANWQDNAKGVVHGWLTNDQATESLKVRYYSVNEEDDYLQVDALYAAGQFYVDLHTDEDGNKSWTFTDKLGRMILTRTQNGTEYCSTYYVYDDLDRLRYVLPPLASDALDTEAGSNYGIDYAPIKNYAYYYRYDAHGNCIEKKLPGAEPQYMVYDKADRLVLSQDGNQRLKNRWMFTKYDAFGRRIMSGSIILPSSTTHASLLSTYKNMLVTESYNGSTTTWGYTDTYFPSASRECFYEINYYDHYKFLSTAGIPGSRTSYMGWQSSYVLDPCFSSSSAKGMLTGTINVVTSNLAMRKYTAYYYDKKGRVVQKNGTNYFNPASNYTYGTEQNSYCYDFKGNLLHTRHRSKAIYNGPTYTEGTINEYDHAGRCTKTKHYFGSTSSAVTTSTNTYNDLGQLATKTYGSGLETQTYSYNIRGWLKKISGDLFSEELCYEKRRDGNTAGLYNGNICQSSWKYLTGAIHDAGWQSNAAAWKSNQVNFSYTYDNLNRMTMGGKDDDLTSFGEQLEYDKHGNIKVMTRGGIVEHGWAADGITPNHTTGAVDELVCYYNGNQLSRIDDYSISDQTFIGGQDFKDYTGEGSEYNYDRNGNMTTNLNKNISTIKYNFLNLSDTIQMGNGHMVINLYDETGDKAFTMHYTATGSTVSMPIGSTLMHNSVGYTTASAVATMYIDNLVYEEWAIDKIQISDGLLIRSNATTASTPTFTYHYYLKDHLGNNRVMLHDAGDATPVIDQVNNYYPFGMEYGESAEDQNEVTCQNYLFGGKEFERKFEVNLYDFEARAYDNMRFTTMDPLAEKYYSISPYAYCSNNPIMHIDPTGKADELTSGTQAEERRRSATTAKASTAMPAPLVKPLPVKINSAASGSLALANKSNDTGKSIQTWVKNNKSELVSSAQSLQTTGDNAALAGLAVAAAGAPVAGVGAAPGLALSACGGTLSTIGTVMEVGVELITGDFSNNKTANAVVDKVAGKIIDSAVNDILPVPVSGTDKLLNESTKTLLNKTVEKLK